VEKRERKRMLSLEIEDNLIRKCEGIASSDWQQEK